MLTLLKKYVIVSICNIIFGGVSLRISIGGVSLLLPWGGFDIKMLSYQYRNSHYEYNIVSWPSYLYNGNSQIVKDGLVSKYGPGDLALVLNLGDHLISWWPVACRHTIFIWFNLDSSWAWWRHQMETFSALLALCAWNSPVNSPHTVHWRGALMFSLICAWISGWVNKQKPGDLRHYSDVI